MKSFTTAFFFLHKTNIGWHLHRHCRILPPIPMAAMWRRMLQNKIKEVRKVLSQLESSNDKVVSNVRHWQTERKYSRGL